MSALGEALRSVKDLSAVTGSEVLAMRKALYADGRVDDHEAQALLSAHRRGARGKCDLTWADFFVEALADYFALERETPDYGVSYQADWRRAGLNVARTFSPLPSHKNAGRDFAWSTLPKAAIRTEEARALISAFRKDGALVLDAVERRLLARLFERAIDTPPELKTFALEAVVETVTVDEAVDEGEVRLLRAVLYGPAGDEGLAISREEAEALFVIGAAAKERAASWRDLFVRAIGKHVLYGGMTPEGVDSAEAAWLKLSLGPPDTWNQDAVALLRFLAREAETLHANAQALVDAAMARSAA